MWNDLRLWRPPRPRHIISTDKPRRQTGTQPRLVTCAQPLFMLPVQRKREEREKKEESEKESLTEGTARILLRISSGRAPSNGWIDLPKIIHLKCKRAQRIKDRCWQEMRNLMMKRQKKIHQSGSRILKWRHFWHESSIGISINFVLQESKFTRVMNSR